MKITPPPPLLQSKQESYEQVFGPYLSLAYVRSFMPHTKYGLSAIMTSRRTVLVEPVVEASCEEDLWALIIFQLD